MSKDYIPRNDEEFDTFFRLLNQYVGQRTSTPNPTWPNIPQPAVTSLMTGYANWYTAFANTFKPHSEVETREKNRVRAESERTLRAFVNQYLRFPPVTNMDRDAMRIPNRDLIRTPHIEVNEVVKFDLVLRNIREILVDFRIKGATHKAKPAGYDGAVIVWDVLAAPPPDLHHLTFHTMASKTPYALKFAEEERGKTVYIAAAWQNERGNVGQWSEVLSTVVP